MLQHKNHTVVKFFKREKEEKKKVTLPGRFQIFNSDSWTL